MFRKPLHLKTSAPLRASDRRAFRAVISHTFLAFRDRTSPTSDKDDSASGIDDAAEAARLNEYLDLLVPPGLMCAKYTTASKQDHGVSGWGLL
jgi:hypothetical protein